RLNGMAACPAARQPRQGGARGRCPFVHSRRHRFDLHFVKEDGSMQTEAEMRKTLVAAAVFLFIAAAPAFAQSYDPKLTTGNITQWYDQRNHLHRNPSPNAAVPYSAYYGGVPVYRPRARVRYRQYWR